MLPAFSVFLLFIRDHGIRSLDCNPAIFVMCFCFLHFDQFICNGCTEFFISLCLCFCLGFCVFCFSCCFNLSFLCVCLCLGQFDLSVRFGLELLCFLLDFYFFLLCLRLLFFLQGSNTIINGLFQLFIRMHIHDRSVQNFNAIFFVKILVEIFRNSSVQF